MLTISESLESVELLEKGLTAPLGTGLLPTLFPGCPRFRWPLPRKGLLLEDKAEKRKLTFLTVSMVMGGGCHLMSPLPQCLERVASWKCTPFPRAWSTHSYSQTETQGKGKRFRDPGGAEVGRVCCSLLPPQSVRAAHNSWGLSPWELPTIWGRKCTQQTKVL